MRELHIDGRRIADDTDAFTICEIGANHQGSVAKCKEIIDAACWAGFDAVKLQKRDLETWAAMDPVAWAKVRDPDTSFGATEGEHRAALEFDWDQYIELKQYAESKGLVFFATAWDVPSLRFLVALGVAAIKVASASIVNRPLLEAIGDTRIPTIMSTGGGTEREIDEAYQWIVSNRWSAHPLAILSCTAEYPCEPRDMNLRVIEWLRAVHPHTVIGLSDHYSGIALTAASYLLGARIIEKHCTVSRTWKGSDQRFSLEPEGMRKLVRDLKRMRLAQGDGVKRRLAVEVAPLVKMGRRDLAEERITA